MRIYFLTCSYVCVCSSVVPKPEKVSWVSAAGAVRDGLRAYTALHTLAHMAVGQTLLVLDGASVSPEHFRHQ